MSSYLLVARNKKDNTFKVIGIKESWYNANAKEGDFSFKNTLASIDLVTSRFASREEMQKRLIDRGYLEVGEYDFFIASKAKSTSSNSVKFHEVIYRPEKNERMAEFREVAGAKCAGDLGKTNEKVLRIFNKLLTKAYHRGDFYYMIQNGYTGLPKKLVDALAGLRESSSVPYSLKYQERWALESYSVIRNIIESLNRFDYITANYNNMVQGNIEYFNENIRGRKALMNRLDKILDKDFSVGQISMFDDGLEDVFAIPKENVVEEVKEEVKPKRIYPVMGAVTEQNKLSSVVNFLAKLPLESFKYVDNKLTFNFDVFDYELDDSTKKKLNSLLTGNLRNSVRAYLFHKSKLEEAKKVDYYGHGQFILQEDMAAEMNDVKKMLSKSDARLNRVYEWCRIYSACGQMNNMIGEDNNQLGDGAISRKR